MKDLATVLLVSDFNIQNLAGYLSNSESEPALQVDVAGHGQVERVLHDATLSCWKSRPDVSVVWTRPQGVLPAFASILNGNKVAAEKLDAEVDDFCGLLIEASLRTDVMLVPTWVVPPYHQGWGLGDLHPDGGVARALMRANARLLEKLDGNNRISALAADQWMQVVGEKAFSARLWYLAKVPFSNELFKEAASRLKSALKTIQRNARKIVIVDLDDTLWGGQIGEVGLERLVLGGHDPIGEALVDFQRELLALTRRGIVLGIVSKNEENVALSAIRTHSEMILRENNFAGWKINWNDKAENVRVLLNELNLGAEAAVFIDDNPVERARVRASIPGILVPNWPTDKRLYPQALLRLDCFDKIATSEEDRNRSKMYVIERERVKSKNLAQSFEEWLRSLQMTVQVEELNNANLMRLTQLLNKTNQMNLATRRLSETQLKDWASKGGNTVCGLRVRDIFGESGLVGILSLATENANAQIVDFVLSCRVLARKIEETMLWLACEWARTRGMLHVVAIYEPTAKNKPCLDFFRRSKFIEEREQHFTWPTVNSYPLCKYIEVSGELPTRNTVEQNLLESEK